MWGLRPNMGSAFRCCLPLQLPRAVAYLARRSRDEHAMLRSAWTSLHYPAVGDGTVIPTCIYYNFCLCMALHCIPAMTGALFGP